MSFDKLIETRIQDAVREGAFEGLRGAGKPLRFDSADELAGTNWMGFKILKNGGTLPAWLQLAREIEDDAARLDGIEEKHREWVVIAAESGEWRRHAPAIGRLRARFVEAAPELRKKQDRYNFEAPTIALERPSVWVDYRVEKLDGTLAEAGAPASLFPWLGERNVARS